MNTLLAKFVLDALVALLLGMTIYFCVKLNRRIRVLQDSKSELAQLIHQFDEATQKATASIVEIQAASRKITENMQMKLEKANFLADDLAFMIEKGNKLADQMESGISASRGKAPRSNPQPQTVQEQPARGGAETLARRASPAQERQQDARAALQQKIAAGSASRSTAASLENVMQRVSGRENAPQQPGRQPPNVRIRSQAEQELYEAVKPKTSGQR